LEKAMGRLASTMGRTAVSLGLAVVLSLGCGGVSPGSKTITPPLTDRDPTEGICIEKPAGGEPTARAQLDGAADALRRGCPREALGRLASLPSPTEDQRTEAALLTVEAREDALAHGFDDLSPMTPFRDLVVEPWMFAGSEPKDELQSLEAIHEAVATGKVGGAFDEGRFARAAIRAVNTYGCARTVALPGDKKIRDMGRELLLRLFKSGALTKVSAEAPGFHRTIARAALWACDLKAAPLLWAKASASARAAGRTDLADEALLAGFEAITFGGGRAGDFELPEVAPAEFAGASAKDEAARQGVGPGVEIADLLDKKLAEVMPELSSPSARARATWVQAVATLRLRVAPSKAASLAADLERQALALRRADVLDASRMIRVLAALDQDDFVLAKRVAEVLQKSLLKRGAMGAIDRGATLLMNAANRYSTAGRSDAVLAAARIADGMARPLPLMPSFKIRAQLPRLLLAVGRVEEAYEIHKDIERDLGPRLKELPYGAGPQLTQVLEMNRRTLRGELGDDELIEPDPMERELRSAIESGDEQAVERFVGGGAAAERDGRVMAGAVLSCSLVRTHIRGVVERLIGALKDISAAHPEELVGQGMAPEAMMELQMGKATLLVQGAELATIAANCGVSLGDRGLVGRARELLTQSSALLGGSAVDPDQVALHEGFALELEGRFDAAARRYLELGRRVYQRAGAGAAGGVGASKRSASMFELGARAALRGGDTELAVAILEESRGRDLRALRSQARTGAGGDLSKLAAIERRVADEQGRARALAQLASTAGDAAQREALKRSLDEGRSRMAALERERDAEAREVASRNPAAYRAAALAPPRSLKEVQSSLGADEVLVYLSGSLESPWAIVVDASSARHVSLVGLTPEASQRRGLGLALAIGRFEHLLKARIKSNGRGLALDGPERQNESQIEAARRDVYARLIAPLEAYVPKGKRLILVPDGASATLPFAELGAEAPLVLRNPLRVVAGAFMLGGRQPARKLATSEVLVVGDPDFGDAEARRGSARGIAATGVWRGLPGTRAEAVAIARAYSARPVLGVEASESAVVNGLSGKRVIHLATHGFADLKRPQYSALILAKPTRAGEDGLLHAFEVERLHLDADVVVLSACETGRGQQRGTEGTFALDRAFLAAGASAVVSSLWVVDDDSTAILMSKFHERLRAGDPADVALRAAMLDVRGRPQHSNAHFWSAFRVVGGGAR